MVLLEKSGHSVGVIGTPKPDQSLGQSIHDCIAVLQSGLYSITNVLCTANHCQQVNVRKYKRFEKRLFSI